jgi:hypothetical protein
MFSAFFRTATGRLDPGEPEAMSVGPLVGEWPDYVAAFPRRAVCFGACSGIGSAPNFMVGSMAVEAGSSKPSLVGYIFKCTLAFRIPGF